MKKDPKAEAIRFWWDKAVESLESARRDLAAQSFSFAINRAYYAVFYAVSALLLEEGRRFQKHSGVHATFNQHLLPTKLLDPKTAAAYCAGQNLSRHEKDGQIVLSFDGGA